MFKNAKGSLLQVTEDGSIVEQFFPFDKNAEKALEEQLKSAFLNIYKIAEKDFEKNGDLFQKFKDTLTDTIFGTAELEQEIRAIFSEASNLETQINKNLTKDTLSRLKLLGAAYEDFTDEIIGYSSEYTEANEDMLRQNNLTAFNSLKDELSTFKGSQEEKEALLKDYQKNYERTEKEITDNVESEAQKRADA